MYRIILFILLSFPGWLFHTAAPAQNNRQFPYALSGYREAALIIPGSLLINVSAWGHNHKSQLTVQEVMQLQPGHINFIDRPATRFWNPELNRYREYLKPTSILMVGGGIVAYGLWYKSRNYEWEALKTLGLMYLEGAYLSIGSMSLTKIVINRPRPYVFNKSLPLEQKIRVSNNESFFSGNATILFYNAVFLSSVIQDIFPESRLSPWIWAASLSIASLSGYWSVRSGMHYPTDVLTGALVGGVAGFFIPRLHKKKIQGLSLQPWIGYYGKGMSVRLDF